MAAEYNNRIVNFNDTAVTDAFQLECLRRKNNPNNESVGNYTGRCRNCGSKNLWDDNSCYGCNDCNAVFFN